MMKRIEQIAVRKAGWIAARIGAAAAALALGAGCAALSRRPPPAYRPMEVIRRPVGPPEKRPFKPGESVALPFHVFNNAVVPPPRNFALSGFMGDITDFNAVGAYTNTLVEKRPALKFQYEPAGSSGWAGATWQNPANSWGMHDGGYNLSDAGTLAFWAKGEKGGEIAEFVVGGAAANFPDSDSIATGPVLLNREWTEYTLDLSPFEMFYIATGFGVIVKKELNPYGCVFYLDDIRYEK